MTAEKTIMCSSGVRFYPVQEFSRLAELNFGYVPCFPLFHVPHDGNEFPEELMKAVTVPRDVFYSYHDKMRDKNVSALIPQAYATQSSVVKFPVSRLLCDPERFIGEEEIMEKYGMGFCYERAYDGTVIKSVTEELKDKTLPYYYRHHDEVDKLCRQHPVVLLFDLHSYSDEIVPEGFIDSSRPTPDVCIGITEKKYTPKELSINNLCIFG